MSANDDNFFPDPKGSDFFLTGMFPATCVAIDPPKPSTLTNDRGENPLTCTYHWRIDGYDDHDQWSFVNVEAWGEKSNFYKVHLALTGKKLDRANKPRPADHIGRRAMLMLVENENKPGNHKVAGYSRIASPPPPRQPQRPAPPPPDDEFGDEVPF